MASFVLIPGAGGMAWYWQRVVPLIRAAGHEPIAVDRPGDDVLRAGPEQPREEAEIVFGEPCRFERWPEIPIHVFAGRDDRFFPIEFQRRVVRERLGKEVEEIPGGHLVALSNAEELTERFLAV
jgi:hypothetical protein